MINTFFPLPKKTEHRPKSMLHAAIHAIKEWFESFTAFGWVIFFICFPLPLFLWFWSKWHNRFKRKRFWHNPLDMDEAEVYYNGEHSKDYWERINPNYNDEIIKN